MNDKGMVFQPHSFCRSFPCLDYFLALSDLICLLEACFRFDFVD